LATKLSENMRDKLKHVFFALLFLFVINAIFIGSKILIWILVALGGFMPSAFSGATEGLAPSFLFSFLGGYYWTRFSVSRFRERSVFVSVVLLPMMLWLVLALPSIAQKKAKEDTRRFHKEARIEKENIKFEEEKLAIRQDTKSCIFNSKKYDLPHTPYFSCKGGRYTIPHRYVTFGLKTTKRTHKLRNDWILEWQNDCAKNIIEDKNCDFVPPPISFLLFENVNSIPPVRGWAKFHRKNNINPERTKLWKNKPHLMPFDNLSDGVIPPDQKILFWSVEPTYLGTGDLANAPLFTNGVRCINTKYYQKTSAEKKDPSLIKKYKCSAFFAIFEGVFDGSIEPSENTGYLHGEVESPVGVSFSYKADSVAEIAEKYIKGQTDTLAYLQYIDETYLDENYVSPQDTE